MSNISDSLESYGRERKSADTPFTPMGLLRSKAPTVATAITLGQMAWPYVKSYRERRHVRDTYTIKVPDTDEIYDDLHEWVLNLLPAVEQKSLIAWTSKVDAYGDVQSGNRVRLRYDGSRSQWVNLGGYDVLVMVSDGESIDQNTGKWKPNEIIFQTQGSEGQQHLLKEINAVADRKRDVPRQPRFRMLSKWGDWIPLDELPKRDLESVILPDGQLDRLISDVEDFFSREDEYLRRCVPYHRGHLYEGPPGTGKTSVARAIATHFGMDIWYLPLADVERDSGLLNIVNRVTPKSMLLLEDIDVFHAATERSDEAQNKATLSGLLNALDGIATPHGLLTVMTTNDVDVLDKAIIRPGRIDLTEHFGLADEHQVSKLLTRWYDEPADATDISDVSPAAVVEVCKTHRTLEGALQALRDRDIPEVLEIGNDGQLRGSAQGGDVKQSNSDWMDVNSGSSVVPAYNRERRQRPIRPSSNITSLRSQIQSRR